MKSFQALLGPILGLAVLLALLAGGYFFFAYVGGVFAALEPPVGTLAAIGSGVLLLSAVIVAEAVKARGTKDSHEAVRRAELYERLLSLWRERGQSPQTSMQVAGDLAATERSLALQGSAEVISAYIRLTRAESGSESEEARQILLKTLVAGMRKDLGRPELVRKEGDVLELLGRPHGGSTTNLADEPRGT